MCDYSLHHVASRPAKVADKIVSTAFNNSITRGFAAVGDPNVAVCLLPGTELAFETEVECNPTFGFLSNRKIGEKVARFRQVRSGRRSLCLDWILVSRRASCSWCRNRDSTSR
jgi:hypothetical protein